jgi:hypothetical protein
MEYQHVSVRLLCAFLLAFTQQCVLPCRAVAFLNDLTSRTVGIYWFLFFIDKQECTKPKVRSPQATKFSGMMHNIFGFSQ